MLRAGCGACNSPLRLPGLGAITGRLEQPPSDLMRLQHRQKDNTPVGWEDGCVRNQTRRIMAPGLGPSRLSRPWCPWLILQSTANSACSISKSCLSFAQASPSRRQTNASPWSIGGFCQLQGLSCHCDSVIASPLRAGQSKKRGAHCPEPPRFFSPEAPFRLRRDQAQVHSIGCPNGLPNPAQRLRPGQHSHRGSGPPTPTLTGRRLRLNLAFLLRRP